VSKLDRIIDKTLMMSVEERIEKYKTACHEIESWKKVKDKLKEETPWYLRLVTLSYLTQSAMIAKELHAYNMVKILCGPKDNEDKTLWEG